MPLPANALYDRFLQLLSATLTVSREELERYQIEALSRLVTFARTEAPYYRGILTRELPCDPANFHDAWNSLPILTRQDIQRRNSEFRPRILPVEFGEISEDETSGSTGTPLKCYASELEEIIFEVTDYFGHVAIANRDLDRTLCIIKSFSHDLFPYAEGYRTAGWNRVAKHLGAHGACHIINISTPIKQQAEFVRSCQPDYVATTPSNLRQLVECLDNSCGIGAVSLREVITFGETVSAELRKSVHDSFGATIRDVYSCTEAGILAFQCRNGLYHTVAPTSYVEVLDKDGRPCADGEVGRVVATPLYKYAMPLIRYQLDDYAVVGTECGCGCIWPALSSIKGRKRNMFRFPDGTVVWPAFNSYFLRDFVPFTTCQIAQISPLTLELRVVQTDDTTGHANLAGLTEYIRQKLGQPVNVVIRNKRMAELYTRQKVEDYVCELVGGEE